MAWCHYLSPFDGILEGTHGRRKDYAIIPSNLAEFAEERIAMAGDADIPWFVRKGGSGNVARRARECVRVGPLRYDYGNRKAGNRHSTERRTFPRKDAQFRPRRGRCHSLQWRQIIESPILVPLIKFGVEVRESAETQRQAPD